MVNREDSRWKEACPGKLGSKKQVLRELVALDYSILRTYCPSLAVEKGPGTHKEGTATEPLLTWLEGTRGARM